MPWERPSAMIQQSLFQSTELRQTLEQQLTPQQIMSLEILMAPLLDLQARLDQEVAANPVLERGQQPNEQLAGDPLEEMGASPEMQSEAAGKAAEQDEEMATIIELDSTWRDYAPAPPAGGHQATAADEERREFFFNSLTAPTTLEDDLLEQLRLSTAPETARAAAEKIIGNIDEAGYLRAKLEELEDPVNGIGADELEAGLALVQSFEPAGVGARDLRECLLLQLQRQEREDELCYRIVADHLDELSRNRIPDIAKALDVSTAEVYQARDQIRELLPHPGGVTADDESTQYVIPEVTITKEDGEYVVTSNDQSMPRVTLTQRYLDLLENPNTPKEIKRYVREKINNGKLLLRSLDLRESTVKRIAEILVDKQRDFFEEGDEKLRPLTMQEVADMIDVHETTVSRAIANKYMQTPRGLLPMRQFFTSGYESSAGEQVSSRGIMQHIKEMIAAEERRKPLSDRVIVERLKENGFDVARRTVAKYREEMGIPSTRLRRKHD